MIDWRLATVVAQAVASAAPSVPEGDTADEVAAFASRSAELVAGYTGLAGALTIPGPETVDRTEWVTANLASMRTVMDPVAGRLGEGLGVLAGPARAAGGALLAVEVGVISGYLAGRVLGQYEFPVLDPDVPARLLFVGPNIAGAAKGTGSDPQAMLRWIALHETTHALQFSGVPWLRPHLAAKVAELVDGLEASIDPRALMRLPSLDDVRGLVDAVRRGEVVELIAGPSRRRVLAEMQALMALVEGYAEHVMDAVGAEVLPDLDRLREAMNRRRGERSGMFRLLEKLIGLDLKLRQYEQGKAFCDAVVAEGGIEALNRAWASPEALPRPEELDAPAEWLRRTAA